MLQHDTAELLFRVTVIVWGIAAVYRHRLH
jgi:hypothetical protein